MALRHGSPTAPHWTKVMEAAAEWACPPWELVGGGQALWWLRWNVYRREKTRIQNEVNRKHG